MLAKSMARSGRDTNQVDRILLIISSFVLVVVASIYFLNAYRIDPLGNFSTYADDTYIHLRFAHHLANGWGIVWNKGEQPVEGSTSFLYMLMMAFIEKIGIQPIWTLAYLCAFFAVLAIVFTLILLQKINKDHLLENLVSVLMLGLSPRLMLWATTGLEVTLYAFALVVCASAYILYRAKRISPWVVGIVFAISSFIRPECLAIFGVTVVFDVAARYSSGERKYHQVLHLLGSFLIIYLPIFLWKWSYFGYPFPNTYYDKTGGGWIQFIAGLSYLRTNLVETFLPSGLLVVVFLVTMKKDAYWVEKIYLLILLLSAWLVVAVNGGDYMLKGRFVTPMLPISYALGGLGISQLSDRIPQAYSRVFLSGLFLTACITWHLEKPIVNDYRDRSFPGARPNKPKEIVSTPEFVAMGKALHKVAGPGDSISLVPIGAVAYYSEMIVYDMVGLVDPVIAHEPFDPKYIEDSWRPGHDKGNGLHVLQQKPTYIVLIDRLTYEPIVGVDDWALQYKSIVEIWDSPMFHEQYEFCPLEITGGWYINLYCRKNAVP